MYIISSRVIQNIYGYILVHRFVTEQPISYAGRSTNICHRKPERPPDFERYLSESGHGLAGDDFISAQTGDEAQGLVLVLSTFQLAQDQSSEDFHILREQTGEMSYVGTRGGPKCHQTDLFSVHPRGTFTDSRNNSSREVQRRSSKSAPRAQRDLLFTCLQAWAALLLLCSAYFSLSN